MSCVFPQIVAQYFLQRLAEVFRLHERLFGACLGPDFDGVVHADEAHLALDAGHLQVAAGDEDAPVAVRHHHFGIADELAEHGLLAGVPAVQPPAQLLLCLEPHALRVEHQAVLEYVFAQHEALLGRGLQLLPEGGGDEHPSLGVGFGLDVAQKT